MDASLGGSLGPDFFPRVGGGGGWRGVIPPGLLFTAAFGRSNDTINGKALRGVQSAWEMYGIFMLIGSWPVPTP